MENKNIWICLYANKELKDYFDKNMKLYIKKYNIDYTSFDVASTSYEKTETSIIIKDNKQEKELLFENAKHTVIFQRGIAFKEYNEVYGLVHLLSSKDFIVINPLTPQEVSSDKYLTSLRLDEYKIPQPKYVLLRPSDIGEDANSETINKVLEPIYKNPKDDDSYVVKILDGHGGTGVFMANHKNILSIMQTLNKISPDRKFLVQKKEEGKGGDIRVHVFTYKDKQFILCALKRKKLGNDFRSNISLGATIEPIKLTKEQEQIALQVGKASGLVWVGVDIMPLKDGRNVVLEYNAEAGGLSDWKNKTGENLYEPLIKNILEITNNDK